MLKFLFFVFNRLHFLEQFQVDSNTEQKAEISHTFPTRHMHGLPIISIPHQREIFVTTDEPTLIPQSAQCTLVLTLGFREI